MGDLNEIKKIKIFREEATSVLTGFYTRPLSWKNWNLEKLAFVEGGKPKPGETPSKQRKNKHFYEVHSLNKLYTLLFTYKENKETHDFRLSVV